MIEPKLEEKEKAEFEAAAAAFLAERSGVAVDLPVDIVKLSAMRQLWEISEKMAWVTR